MYDIRVTLAREAVEDTENITISKLLPEDAEDVLRLRYMNPTSSENFTFFERDITVDQEKAYITEKYMSEDTILFRIDHKKSRKLIGTCGLHEFDPVLKKARLGIIIFDSSQHGKGYGSEVIELLSKIGSEYLGVQKIIAKVRTTNKKVIRFYLRQGFEKEALLKAEYFLRGERHDMIQFSKIL